MRYSWLLIVVSLSLSGCGYYSSSSIQEDIVITKQESATIPIDDANDYELLLSFIERINEMYPKAIFEIDYFIENQLLIESLKEYLNSQGLLQNRFEFSTTHPNSNEINIRAIYRYVEPVDCGVLNIFEHGDYNFGCTVNYNQSINIFQPKDK